MQFTKKKKKVTNHNLTNRQIPVKSTYEMPLLFCNTWAKIKLFFFFNKTSVGKAMGSGHYLIFYGEYKLV